MKPLALLFTLVLMQPLGAYGTSGIGSGDHIAAVQSVENSFNSSALMGTPEVQSKFAAFKWPAPLHHGAFTLNGVNEYPADTGWVAATRIFSVYDNGLLTRQAIVYSPSTLTLQFYLYGPTGLLLEERVVNGMQLIWGSPETYDATITYTYNDSGRIAQTVEHRPYSWGNEQIQRSTYSYDNAGLLQEIVAEWNDAGEWLPYQRSEYLRPARDSAIVTVSQWNGDGWYYRYRNLLQYDQAMRVASETYEYYTGNGNSWYKGSKTTYGYDDDGVMRSSTSWSWGGNGWMPGDRFVSTRTPAPSIVLMSLDTQQWAFSSDTITVRFLGTGENAVHLDFSTDNGGTWNTFASALPDTGFPVYRWVPGTALGAVRIRAAAGSAADATPGTIDILPGREMLTHTTGNIQCAVFSTGCFGTAVYDHDGSFHRRTTSPGFRYKGGPNALFSGGVIVGQPGGTMGGIIGSFGFSSFVPAVAFNDFTSDAHFDQLTSCTISEGPPNYPLQIEQKTASRTGDDFITVSYDVKNMGEEVLSNFCVGFFADWDIGPNFSHNRGQVDVSRGMAYEYDPSGSDPNYYGVVALSGFSGGEVTTLGPGIAELVSATWGGGGEGDLRTFIVSPPSNFDPGIPHTIAFALVAGTTLLDLQAHMDSARALWDLNIATGVPSAREPVVFSLDQNYPNPFNPSTNIRYTVARTGPVSLKVYDLLGREVRTLVNENQDVGTHEVTFEANGLASGVYFYRLEAGEFEQTKRLLLLR